MSSLEEKTTSQDDFSPQYVLVSSFFNIGRGDWSDYGRSTEKYMANARRLSTLDDHIIFILPPEMISAVKEFRKERIDKTYFIEQKLVDLPYYQLRFAINEIMQSSSYKQGLVDPVCPEVTKPLYNVIMWSKVWLLMQAIKHNPFDSKRFVWIDFGIHEHMLQNRM